MPVIRSALTASGNVGAAFSYQISATRSPTSFDAVNLPAGLGVNRSNGVISGTPSAAGTDSVVISATNAYGTGTATAVFRVFAAPPRAAAADLERARVYPVPYKPSGGAPGEGKPYSAGDPASGIIFDNLPAAVTLKIYTLSGRLAAQLGTGAGTGTIRWDAKNEAGRDVASGGYFAVISSPGCRSVVKRLLVIR
ncbi:MAG: Ig domain-containing protein [Elusimicrobia bacterium]|nr:Ig domain-containing protein [Elusimicrobiota bacterium]